MSTIERKRSSPHCSADSFICRRKDVAPVTRQNRIRTALKRFSSVKAIEGSPMISENRTWGAPRIHGELRMLGLCCALFNIRDLRQVLARPETPPLTPNISSLFVFLTGNSRCNLGRIEFWRGTAVDDHPACGKNLDSLPMRHSRIGGFYGRDLELGELGLVSIR